jgi:Tfp pilus assembly PilM family ATPase
MANHIIGLDIGTYSIKLVRIERGRDPRVLSFDEEPLPRFEARTSEATSPGEASPSEASPAEAGTGPVPSDFDDAPTQVRRRDELEDEGGDWPDSGGGTAGPPPMPDGGSQMQAPDGEPLGPGDEDAEPEDDVQEALEGWEIALDRLIERGAFDDDGLVVTFLPAGQAMSIHQQVPFKERAKIENILPHMLDDRLPVDPSQVVYDFQLIDSTVDEGAEAVIGFARKEQVGEFLDELKAHHVDPAVLGIPELLLTYALERCAPSDGGTYAVVDIGHRYTRVLVIHKGEPAVARSVQFGGHNLTEAIAKRFDSTYEQAENYKEHQGVVVGPDDAPTDETRALSDCIEGAFSPFVRDLRRTFQALFARSRIQIDQIFVCGGTSQLENLPDYLGREFGVPVMPLPIERVPGLSEAGVNQVGLDGPGLDGPGLDGSGVSGSGLSGSGLSGSSKNRPPNARLAMAASCALQQLDGRDEERLIDLRKGEFSYRGKSSYLRSKMIQFGAAAAILILLVVGMLFTQKIQMEAQRDSMRAALEQQTTTLFGEPLFSNDDIKKRLTGEATSEKGYIPKMSAYQLYYELASRVPEDLEVTLSRFEIDVDRNVAQVYGQTSSPQDVERLMEDLRKLDCLKDVRQEGELKIKADSEVDFHLHISSECS